MIMLSHYLVKLSIIVFHDIDDKTWKLKSKINLKTFKNSILQI